MYVYTYIYTFAKEKKISFQNIITIEYDHNTFIKNYRCAF